MKHTAFRISVHTEASGNAPAIPDCLGRGGWGHILSSKSWESGQKGHMPCKSPHVITRANTGCSDRPAARGCAEARLKWGTARPQSCVCAGGAGGQLLSISVLQCPPLQNPGTGAPAAPPRTGPAPSLGGEQESRRAYPSGPLPSSRTSCSLTTPPRPPLLAGSPGLLNTPPAIMFGDLNSHKNGAGSTPALGFVTPSSTCLSISFPRPCLSPLLNLNFTHPSLAADLFPLPVL